MSAALESYLVEQVITLTDDGRDVDDIQAITLFAGQCRDGRARYNAYDS